MYGCVWRGGGLTAPSQCPWAHGRSTHSSPSRARIARAPCPWRGASGRPTGSGRWIYVGSLNSNFTEQPGQPQSSHRRDQRVVAGHCLTCGRLAASAHPKLDLNNISMFTAERLPQQTGGTLLPRCCAGGALDQHRRCATPNCSLATAPSLPPAYELVCSQLHVVPSRKIRLQTSSMRNEEEGGRR